MDKPDLAIFYANGDVVECSNDDQVEVTVTFKVSRQYLEAPSHGVQGIVQRDEETLRHVLRGKDYYHAMPDGMINSTSDLMPFFEHYIPGVFKYGVCLEIPYWNASLQQMKAYTGIPRK
jgi:hypothetical protein